MNAPVRKPKTALVSAVKAIGSGDVLPSLPSPKEWKAFDRFVADCDKLVEHDEWLCSIDRNLDKVGGYLPEIETIKRKHEGYRRILKDCTEGLRRFDHARDDDGNSIDSRYDRDGALTTEYVTTRLVVLAACYPSPPEPLFSAMLLLHVMALEPSAAELESACRRLVERENKAFLHIGDVTATLKAEREIWGNRRATIGEPVDEEFFRELVERVSEETAKREAEQKEREAEQQKQEAEAAARQEAHQKKREAAAAAAEARRKQQQIIRDRERLIARIARRHTAKWRIATRMRERQMRGAPA
jgi:hypothetical protein